MSGHLDTAYGWSRKLGIAENTLSSWVLRKGLKAEQHGDRSLIDEAELRSFVVKNPQFPAARRALAGLDTPETIRPAAAAAAAETSSDDDTRQAMRALRARVATLAEELEVARRELNQVRAERDVWRSRSRTHRASLRAQLDLEDEADAAPRG
jgi:hypothetical protein